MVVVQACEISCVLEDVCVHVWAVCVRVFKVNSMVTFTVPGNPLAEQSVESYITEIEYSAEVITGRPVDVIDVIYNENNSTTTVVVMVVHLYCGDAIEVSIIFVDAYYECEEISEEGNVYVLLKKKTLRVDKFCFVWAHQSAKKKKKKKRVERKKTQSSWGIVLLPGPLALHPTPSPSFPTINDIQLF